VLACAGVTEGAARAALYSTGNPVVVEPAVLLEAMARMIELEGPRVMSESEVLDLIGRGLPLDGDGGYDVVGHRLLNLLTAAPPMLSRADLTRLMAGLRVAPPPPL
jgi:hypothetical protein